MAEVTNELMYEVLKALRDDVARVQDGQQDIRTELQAIRGHMLAVQTDIGMCTRFGRPPASDGAARNVMTC